MAVDSDYSLMHGGLVYRGLDTFGIANGGMRRACIIGVLLVGSSIIPILVGTAIDGTLYGDRVVMPLLGDYAVLSRFLVAVPLLILFSVPADALLRQTIDHFPRSGMVRQDTRAQFDDVIKRAMQLRNSMAPELVCLAIAFLPIVFDQRAFSLVHGISEWRTTADGESSFAGSWLSMVAVPIFRFVGLVWIWRLCLWTYLLWRLARIDLHLSAAHPDGAAGLAFLGIAQYRFSVLALVGGILVAGSCVDQVIYLGATLATLKYLLAGYIVSATILLTAPLLVMCPKLIALKRAALMNYGTLGHSGASGFDQRWLGQRASDSPSMLDANDPSSVADFAAVYNTIRTMSVVPLTRYNLLGLAVAAAFPMIPVLFVAMPLDDLLKRLVSILA